MAAENEFSCEYLCNCVYQAELEKISLLHEWKLATGKPYNPKPTAVERTSVFCEELSHSYFSNTRVVSSGILFILRTDVEIRGQRFTLSSSADTRLCAASACGHYSVPNTRQVAHLTFRAIEALKFTTTMRDKGKQKLGWLSTETTHLLGRTVVQKTKLCLFIDHVSEHLTLPAYSTIYFSVRRSVSDACCYRLGVYVCVRQTEGGVGRA